jgi:ATP-dependent Lon protease
MEEEYNKVTEEDVLKVLGVPRLERDKYESNDVAGVVTGLAWTSVGGDILLLNRCSPGKGGMTIRKLRYGDERISDNCFRIY